MKQGRRHFFVVLGGVAAMLPMTKFPTPGNVYEHLKGCWSFYETEDLLNGKPLRIEDVQCVEKHSGAVLFHAGRDRAQVNRTALRIWELCDGKNSPEGIAYLISNEFEVPFRACFGDVVLALRTFRRHGLIVC